MRDTALLDLERSYVAAARYFHTWVRMMEFHSRRTQVAESRHAFSKVVVLSPPTDAGIGLLAAANRQGQTHLICFSKRLEQIAMRYCNRQRIDGLTTEVTPFFQLPFKEGEVSAVYANCFFDFCQEGDFDLIAAEIRRVLDEKGLLFAVYMSPPTDTPARLWGWIFRRLHFLSQGCHPVCVAPYLERRGFRILVDRPARRCGFPLWYTKAEKTT